MMTRLRRVLLLTLAGLAGACDGATQAPPGTRLAIGELLGGVDTLHARAIAPRAFVFPRDHGAHPDFRTEWWYFTGNLTAADGRELGYQLTFFRSALADSASYAGLTGRRSRWRTRHAWMAHFAVTDPAARVFRSAEKFARGAAGLAGAEAAPLRVWLEDWSAESLPGVTTFPLRLRADAGDVTIDLVLERGKPIVLQGDSGLSRKGAEPGNASYYYSLTRMPTRGTLRAGADTITVTGTSWLDREWSTSALAAGVQGWDWMALQLDDATELMLYRLRRDDGTADPFSAATFVAPDGTARTLAADEFVMTPTRTWHAHDGAAYPTSWRIGIPALDLELTVSAALEDQELDLSVRYWEGMVHVSGTRDTRAVTGRGYLEMTGYAGSPDRVR